MSCKQVILNPPVLVQGLQHAHSGRQIEGFDAHDDVGDRVLHPAEQEIDLSVLDKQRGLVLPRLQSRLEGPGMRFAHHVDVLPELALRGPVVVGDQADEVALEEVLAEFDVGVIAVQILDVDRQPVCGLRRSE